MPENEVLKRLNAIAEGLQTEATDEAPVQKSFTPANLDQSILNQKFGRGLDIDEGNAFADLVVDQSQTLGQVFVDVVSTLSSTINVYEGNGALTQTAEGEDPFATSANLATYGNIGYDVVLQPMQFIYRITKSQLMAIKQSSDWEAIVNRQMSVVFANLLLKQALFGTPSTGGDTDIEHGYNYIGTTIMGKPRVGVRGWLDTLKKGYMYKKDGVDVLATVGAVVNTYDTAGSKYKAINVILEEMVKSYPADHDGENIVIMLSRSDFIDFVFYVAGKDASTAKYETGKVYSIGGYSLTIMPFLTPYNKTVTISATDYYPGMVLMGRMKDLVIKINNTQIDFSSAYYEKLRTFDSIYDVPVAFGAIIQRFAIAYRVR